MVEGRLRAGVLPEAGPRKGPFSRCPHGEPWGNDVVVCGGAEKMELLKSEAGVEKRPADLQSQPEDQTGTSAAANNTSDRPPQSAAMSIASDGRCCVLKNSSFDGRLQFDGPLRIECQVGGEIYGSDVITVAESAFVTGPIQAPSVLIAGRVSADITASERIEIRSSGRVSGNLTAPAMMVHENALVEGRFTMTHGRRPQAS
jgi:cytoskeletal protein CcmA (bactofilin family)